MGRSSHLPGKQQMTTAPASDHCFDVEVIRRNEPGLFLSCSQFEPEEDLVSFPKTPGRLKCTPKYVKGVPTIKVFDEIWVSWHHASEITGLSRQLLNYRIMGYSQPIRYMRFDTDNARSLSDRLPESLKMAKQILKAVFIHLGDLETLDLGRKMKGITGQRESIASAAWNVSSRSAFFGTRELVGSARYHTKTPSVTFSTGTTLRQTSDSSQSARPNQHSSQEKRSTDAEKARSAVPLKHRMVSPTKKPATKLHTTFSDYTPTKTMGEKDADQLMLRRIIAKNNLDEATVLAFPKDLQAAVIETYRPIMREGRKLQFGSETFSSPSTPVKPTQLNDLTTRSVRSPPSRAMLIRSGEKKPQIIASRTRKIKKRFTDVGSSEEDEDYPDKDKKRLEKAYSIKKHIKKEKHVETNKLKTKIVAQIADRIEKGARYSGRILAAQIHKVEQSSTRSTSSGADVDIIENFSIRSMQRPSYKKTETSSAKQGKQIKLKQELLSDIKQKKQKAVVVKKEQDNLKRYEHPTDTETDTDNEDDSVEPRRSQSIQTFMTPDLRRKTIRKIVRRDGDSNSNSESESELDEADLLANSYPNGNMSRNSKDSASAHYADNAMTTTSTSISAANMHHQVIPGSFYLMPDSYTSDEEHIMTEHDILQDHFYQAAQETLNAIQCGEFSSSFSISPHRTSGSSQVPGSSSHSHPFYVSQTSSVMSMKSLHARLASEMSAPVQNESKVMDGAGLSQTMVIESPSKRAASEAPSPTNITTDLRDVERLAEVTTYQITRTVTLSPSKRKQTILACGSGSGAGNMTTGNMTSSVSMQGGELVNEGDDVLDEVDLITHVQHTSQQFARFLQTKHETSKELNRKDTMPSLPPTTVFAVKDLSQAAEEVFGALTVHNTDMTPPELKPLSAAEREQEDGFAYYY